MSDKTPRFPPQSRYAEVAGYSRRSVLGIGLGALATLVSCRSSDDDIFANDSLTNETATTEVAAGDAGSDTAGTPTDATMEVQVDGQGAAIGSETGAESSSTTGLQAPEDTTTSAVSGETTVSDTSSPPSSTTSSTASPTTTSETTTSAAPATSTTATTSATSTTRSAGPATALPAGADLVVNFTYEQAAGGKNVPPYIAVWIEDDSGDLVETVALWYQQFGRGENWLPDLRRWYNTTGGSVADSGPTRAPGQHQVAWSGSSEFGAPMPPGRYYVCVESARERGPYSLVRTAVDLSGGGINVQLGADGELKAASARTA